MQKKLTGTILGRYLHTEHQSDITDSLDLWNKFSDRLDTEYRFYLKLESLSYYISYVYMYCTFFSKNPDLYMEEEEEEEEEGQSKITEPYLITFESSKMDIY